MRVAVVGHVEWIRFCRVTRLPGPGDIAHSIEDWEQAGGGGGVAAIQLARLADEALLFTVLGDDELGRRSREELELRGVQVRSVTAAEPQRWAFTHIDETGERTITTVGRKLRPRGNDDSLPWHELREVDAVFFVAGDEDALRRARAARVLTATSRELAILRRAGVELDALIGSGKDEAERYRPGELEPPPVLVVSTSGSARRLVATGRAVLRRRSRGSDRGHLRRRGLLRSRAHLRARCRRGAGGGDRVRRPLRCRRADRSGRGTPAGHVARLEG